MSTTRNDGYTWSYGGPSGREDEQRLEREYLKNRQADMEAWEKLHSLLTSKIRAATEFTEETYYPKEDSIQEDPPPRKINENKYDNMKSKPYAKKRNFRIESQEERSDFMDGIRKMKNKDTSIIANEDDGNPTGYGKYKNTFEPIYFQDPTTNVAGVLINDDNDDKIDFDDEDDEIEEDND